MVALTTYIDGDFMKKEVQEFLRYARRGLPMLITVVLISLLIGGIVNLLPPVGIPIAVGITAVFASAALGIVKEIADDDEC